MRLKIIVIHIIKVSSGVDIFEDRGGVLDLSQVKIRISTLYHKIQFWWINFQQYISESLSYTCYFFMTLSSRSSVTAVFCLHHFMMFRLKS